MIAANAYGMPASGWMTSLADRAMRVCAIRLVDRRTGATHRVNGRPLVVFSRQPDEAVAQLLAGRDPSVWEARVEPLNPADGRKGVRK